MTDKIENVRTLRTDLYAVGHGIQTSARKTRKYLKKRATTKPKGRSVSLGISTDRNRYRRLLR